MLDIDVMLGNIKAAKDYKKEWVKQAQESNNFVVGDQWDEVDLEKCRREKRPALTFNKIQPLIFFISGLQRQNRSDYKAFPIGEEDSIKADCVTMILKDMTKNANLDFIQSEQFEHGLITGEGWLEPFISYCEDLLNGDIAFSSSEPVDIFVDPASRDYLHEDAAYIVKTIKNISKEQILSLYPDQEKKLAEITEKTFISDTTGNGIVVNTLLKYEKEGTAYYDAEELAYEIDEYHYYEQKKIFLIQDKNDTVEYESFETEKEAKDVANGRNERYGTMAVRVLSRFINVPRVAIIVNGELLVDFVSPFYPAYKKIPVFSFYCHWLNAKLEKRHLSVQGIVHSLKDPQREINKRKSQSLHHLNSSVNSGFFNKKQGGMVDKEAVKKFGSTPGVIIDYETEKPERIFPMPLDTAHEQMAQMATQDIKEISGLNTDLLAMNDKTNTSGRAIHLRTQQGMLMLQRILDNFSRTKREVGRFLISQIGTVYNEKKARRAIGESWIKDHFSKPVMQIRKDPYTGQPIIDQNTGQPEQIPVMKPNGQMETYIDEQEVSAFIKMILDDVSISRYDVAVAEIATSETIRLSNYAMMMELMGSGVPVPPDVLMEESALSEQAKLKIRKSIAQAQATATKEQK